MPADLEQAVADALTKDLDRRLPAVTAFAARIAPFGSDAARASLERIERIAARAPPPTDETVADGPPSSLEKASPDVTRPAAPTAQSIASARETVPPRPSRMDQVSTPNPSGMRSRRVAAVAAIGALAAASLAAFFVVRASRKPDPSSVATAGGPAPVCPLADADKGDVCKECRNEKCCAGKTACDESSACRDYLDCLRSCDRGVGCRDACIRKHPDGHAVATPYLACINSRCVADCGGNTPTAECNKCQLASCPDPMISCLSNPGCDAQYACEAACSAHDDACKQRCRSEQAPGTQKMLNDFVLCGARYCESACK